MKRAYVFPGQGSQCPGMGKSLYESNGKARELMESANDILGFRITDVMFEGSEEELKSTDVAQPSIFLHSVCLALTVPDLPSPDMVGGHSLGEFSALIAAGAMDFETGLRLVTARARAMQRCCAAVPGAMAAIINFPEESIESICASIDGIVLPANYNCDGQVVISGEVDAVDRACAALKEAGAKRALPLKVAGAFHSPLMEPARLELAAAIDDARLCAPLCPVYQNVSAEAETDPVRIKENLLLQLTSPVRWTQSVRRMLSDGAGEFIEIGPGTVLQGLVKRISASENADVHISALS